MSDTRLAEQVREFNKPRYRGSFDKYKANSWTELCISGDVFLCIVSTYNLSGHDFKCHTQARTHKLTLTWRYTVDIVWSCLSCVVQSEKEANGASPSYY
jgi:hypothetical protein